MSYELFVLYFILAETNFGSVDRLPLEAQNVRLYFINKKAQEKHLLLFI